MSGEGSVTVYTLCQEGLKNQGGRGVRHSATSARLSPNPAEHLQAFDLIGQVPFETQTEAGAFQMRKMLGCKRKKGSRIPRI